MEKLFTCADGSGTFHVVLNARRDQSGTEQFRWVIRGGTDDYVGLTGAGDGSTSIEVVNIYDGRVILRAK